MTRHGLDVLHAVRSKVRSKAVSILVTLLAAFALLGGAREASAAPEAHILRIDPRASQTDGSPILTTVLELVQNKRLSDLTGACATLTGDANLSCVSEKLEQPGATFSSFDFPDKNAVLTVSVDGTDLPAKFDSKARWGESLNQPGVGTAWLILVDSASTMGERFEEAKQVALAFANSMTPNDIADVMLFNDRSVVLDSKWVGKQAAVQFIQGQTRTFPVQGRTRPLSNIIINAVTDAFKEQGNAGLNVTFPMHQALVLLSSGLAGADASSGAPAAFALRDKLTKGRFPEDNQVLPRTPVPTISIYFPAKQIEEFGANAREYMENLANTELGGFYFIVKGSHATHAPNIVNAVRTRFNKMHIVKWRVACVAPTISQSFKLVFMNTNPPMAGDTWQNVPVGIDPTTWPLDIDRDATEKAAKKDPIYPGGSVKIYGSFCWGGNAQRAEIYMVPKNQAAPQTVQGGSLDDAKKAQQSFIQQGMRGKAVSAGDTFVEFELPNSEKWLTGKGDNASARIILYDNQARRTSAITADKILTLRAREAPPPYLLIAGIAFGGMVLVLLVVSIVRGGGGGKRRGGVPAPTPRPIVGGAAPPPGPAFAAAVPAPPMGGFGGPDLYGGPAPMPAPANVTRATLSGAAGIFTVLPGMEMRAGRDGSACQILLTEPRVSGVHATVKLESGQLLVRDENSNNGTFLNGQRLQGGLWTPVPAGAALRFGPVEFSVRLE